MRSATGRQAHGPTTRLRRVSITRRDLRRAEDPPLVPGHEFTGVVTGTGPDVTRFRVGDIVDSCGACAPCAAAGRTSAATSPP